MSKTNAQVAHSFYDGTAAKSGNGNFSTDGFNLYSYNMLIGRTLEDETKQVLNVSGVHSYSVTTSQHVQNALHAGHCEVVQPEHKRIGYSGWRVFQTSGTVKKIHATSKTWKTFNGATKALVKADNALWFVNECYGGYTLAFNQYVGVSGHVVSADEYYNED